MSMSYELFQSLAGYMLPFNLRQCFDAFRLSMLLEVESICPPERMARVRACLNALTADRRQIRSGSRIGCDDSTRSLPTATDGRSVATRSWAASRGLENR